MSPGGDCRFHCWRVTWILGALLLLPRRRVGVHVSRWGLPLSLLACHMDSAFVAKSACGRACLQVGTAAFIVDASHGFCFCCHVRRVGVHVSRWGLPLSLLARRLVGVHVSRWGLPLSSWILGALRTCLQVETVAFFYCRHA